MTLLQIQSRMRMGRRLDNRFLKVHIAYSIQLSLSSIMSSRLQPSLVANTFLGVITNGLIKLLYIIISQVIHELILLFVVLTSNQASTLEASEEAPVSVDWPSTSTAALSYD